MAQAEHRLAVRQADGLVLSRAGAPRPGFVILFPIHGSATPLAAPSWTAIFWRCPNWRRSNGIASNGTPASAKRLSMFGYIRETGFFGEQIPANFVED